MPHTVEPVTVALGPAARGAPDELRPLIEETVVATTGGIAYVMTQQLADRRVAERILAGAAAIDTDVRVLVETEFLAERRPTPSPWAAMGTNEAARVAYNALLRAAVPVRSDYVAGSLMHSNIAIRDGDAAITSANLTTGSLDRHYNALVRIRDPVAAGTMRAAFMDAWDGDFRKSAREATVPLADGGACSVVAGGEGVTVEALAHRIDAAQQSIQMAIFTFASGNRLFTAIASAIARGVTVTGVVDADQAPQRWDAVAPLQALGADVRYHAGALTGAPGRMHHKLLLIDGGLVCIGTTNFSNAALKSHEAFVFLTTGFSAYVGAELDRLFAAGTAQAPPPLPPA